MRILITNDDGIKALRPENAESPALSSKGMDISLSFVQLLLNIAFSILRIDAKLALSSFEQF